MGNQARIPAPNYTQVPNAIFDLMADKDAGLTEKELKVLLAVARKTFGWHKKRDKISLTQLEQLTSLSRPSVVAGLESAIERGIIRRTPDSNDKRGGVFYELVVEDIDQSSELTSKDFELVNNSNQLKELTKTSKDFEPELVKNLNTQKKEKETIKETPTPPAPTAKHNGAGGGDEIEHLLDEYNIGAAVAISQQYQRECPNVDVATIRQSIDNLIASQIPMGTIVKRLMRHPPEPGKPYQRSKVARNPTERVAPTVGLAKPPPPPPDAQAAREAAKNMLALRDRSRGQT